MPGITGYFHCWLPHTGDAVELVEPLPESPNGDPYILVIGDYFTCWMEALCLPNQEASIVAGKLVDKVFPVFHPRAVTFRSRSTV